MKKFSLVCLISILVMAWPFARLGESQTDETTKKELLKSIQGLWQAWQKQDAKPFEQKIAPQGLYVNHLGPEAASEMIKSVAAKECQVKSFSIDESSARLTKIDANTYIITYKAEQDAVCQGSKLPSPVYSSEVWVKHGADWKNHFYQETAAQTPSGTQ